MKTSEYDQSICSQRPNRTQVRFKAVGIAAAVLLRLGVDSHRLHYDRDRDERPNVVFNIVATVNRRVSLVARLSLEVFCVWIFSVSGAEPTDNQRVSSAHQR